MLDVVGRKSKLGKALDDYKISRQKVSVACGGVAMETISRWCNLDNAGKPRQQINQEHLTQLTQLINYEANVQVDPTDLLEEPDYYINNLRVVGSLSDKGKIKTYSKQKTIQVNTKYPPDTASIEMVRNSNKTYYFIFEEINRDPNKSLIHNSDAVLYDEDGIFAIARDVQIYGDELRYFNMAQLNYETITDKLTQSIPINKIKYFHIITDLKIVLSN